MSNSIETPAQILARSVLGFNILALIPAIITWVMLAIAPASPSMTFQKIQFGIVIMMGVIVLGLTGLTLMSYRWQPSTVLPVCQKICDIFSQSLIAICSVLLIIEVNLLAFTLLNQIAPTITNPAKLLLGSWSVIVLGLLFLINRPAITSWMTKTQAFWIGTGLFVVAMLMIGLLLVVNNTLINRFNLNDLLRGGLDYRELSFIDDGQPVPRPQDYWREVAQIRVRWSPYTYWVMDAFDGEYINSGSNGLRDTIDYTNGAETASVYVFGGSTVWGEGARDAYTIPSLLARLLSDANMPQQVVNYGQSGYVSTQDLIWFQLQLAQGNVPDVAIFYQGFNDILSAWSAKHVGVTLQEEMRMNDAETGRLLRSGQPVLGSTQFSLNTIDLSQAGVMETTPEAIVDRWLANVGMIRTLAEAYDVQVLFIWQPAIIYKSPRSVSEQAIYARWDQERNGLFDLYQQVDNIVLERLATDNDVILLSDLFAGNEHSIFHDLVHINELGNTIVAENILPALQTKLNTLD